MAQLSGRRILVVEDEYYLATDVARILRGAGAEVLGPCPDSEDALQRIESERPDCAVLDVNLGAGASFVVADRLAAKKAPFLFFTGYDRAAIPERFADVVRLEKPVGDVHLLKAVATLCG